MIIKKLVIGPLENNCFIIGDETTREAFVIDPGDEPDRILDLLEENNLKVKFIICTHAHFDHVGAIAEIKEETGAKIIIHHDELPLYNSIEKQAAMWGFQLEALPEPDLFVSEGDKIEIGNLRFRVIHTPGHTPGGICLFGEGIIITGDTLFAGSVGRTDLFGGNIDELRLSVRRLMALPDETEILPGHGSESNIGKEKSNN
ncbi:MAG: MBL fold metallo-hydrolase, partial [Nitrospirota bacterium]